jgi:hypothetical protein
VRGVGPLAGRGPDQHVVLNVEDLHRRAPRQLRRCRAPCS